MYVKLRILLQRNILTFFFGAVFLIRALGNNFFRSITHLFLLHPLYLFSLATVQQCSTQIHHPVPPIRRLKRPIDKPGLMLGGSRFVSTQKHNINYMEPGHPGNRLSPSGGPEIRIRNVRVIVNSHTIAGIDYITRHCLNHKASSASNGQQNLWATQKGTSEADS